MQSDIHPPNPPAPIERNPVTHKIHRREVFWQITIPLLIGAVVLLALGVLSSLGASGDVSQRADVSLIWLIPPMFLLVLIGIILVGGIAFGVIKLIAWLPPRARLAQDFFVQVSALVRKMSDAAVEPVLRPRGFFAGLKALRRK